MALPRDPSLRTSAFRRYFSAVSVSAFGTTLTAVALPVLLIDVMDAEAFEVGIANAAQFVPYAVLGLFAGVYTDRWNRQRLLVWASIGRAVMLALVPLLWWAGLLQFWVLVALLVGFGSFAVFGFAATQSLLPQIVERRALLAANARLDQAEAAAQTAGPALGGAVVGLIGAPLAILVDAVTYVVDAVLIAGAALGAPPVRPARRSVRKEIAEGLRWTYGHGILRPLAVSTHVWFFANAAALTVLAVLALRGLGLTPLVYGLILASAGAATLLGADVTPRLSRHLGAGATIAVGRLVYPIAWGAIALATLTEADAATLGILFTAFALQGFAGGIENANEMSLRQAVTPDALLGRTSATMRSVNRTAAVLGALAGGAAATAFGVVATLAVVCAVFAVAFVVALAPALRSARLDDAGAE